MFASSQAPTCTTGRKLLRQPAEITAWDTGLSQPFSQMGRINGEGSVIAGETGAAAYHYRKVLAFVKFLSNFLLEGEDPSMALLREKADKAISLLFLF